MKTMKQYKEPVTIEVLLLSGSVMKLAGENSLPDHVSGLGEAGGSEMFDAPLGNKRRQL